MLRIQTPSRLHFGLMVPGGGWPRRYGGLGLALKEPGWVIESEPANDWQVVGESADRAGRVLARLLRRPEFAPASALRIRIVQAIPAHVGLGSGTQLACGLAQLLAQHLGLRLNSTQLVHSTGRGLRSGIGLAAFQTGGFIVDFGRASEGDGAPTFLRLSFPADWRVAVLIPDTQSGLHGDRESEVFAHLDRATNAASDRLCRLAMLIIPALLERRYAEFAEGLYEYNRLAGECFAAWQHGPYHSPLVSKLVAAFRESGIAAVGQSSWGPAVFAIAPEQWLQPAVQAVTRRYQSDLIRIMITEVAGQGAIPGGEPFAGEISTPEQAKSPPGG